MIPIKNSFMFDYDEILDKFKVNILLDKGYSRIPVYSNHNRNDINGLLRIKQLIGVDLSQNKTLRQLGVDISKPLVISPRLSLLDLLREFRKGKSHMAFITEQVEELQAKYGLNRSNSVQRDGPFFYGKNSSLSLANIKILGIITLEDVIERMINLDILDEDDYERAARNNKSTNKLSKLMGKDLAKSLIKEESARIDMMVKESFSRKKSIKDLFFGNKSGDDLSSLTTPKYLKDTLI